MTQKTLPNKFHPAINLYRLSVKRTAGLTVLITVFSLLFCPGYVLMTINSELKYQVNTLNAAAKTVDFADMCPGIIFFTAAASTAIAVLYLFINFSFLYGRSSSDFFHSLPVKRGGLLFSRFFASVVPVLIPITLVYISMGFITAMKSVNGNIKTVIFGFITNVLITVMCCAFSLIFIVCAGSIFDLIISFFTFNLGIIMVQLINASLCGGFLFGFPSVSFGKLFSVSSPFYYAFSGLMRFVTNFSPQRAMLWYAVKLTAVTAVSLVAASLLYNRRRSEKSGVSYAYRFIYVICGLTVGFIGLAECLKAMMGVHHGESDEAQEKGLEIIGHMRTFTDNTTKDTGLNFSLIATPAEGLSGRFTRIDKKKYGEIPGVTDRDYYTNSMHVPVYYNISAFDKIRKEAPYHALCNGGHIAYIELDGDPTKNLAAFEKVVKAMDAAGIGYGAINHPVDRDPCCGFSGIIGDTCPKCGRKAFYNTKGEYNGINFDRIRRITGYLVGTLEKFNDGKRAEEADRIKHKV